MVWGGICIGFLLNIGLGKGNGVIVVWYID